MKYRAIGIDIGGSYIKAGVVQADRTIIYEHTPIPTPNNGSQLVATVRTIITDILVEQSGIDAIGIASCGVLSPDEGIIYQCVAIANYAGTNWYRELQDFGIPVRLENDGHVAAWTEFKDREAEGINSLIHVIVGTGLGCGIVIAGKVWQGDTYMAGEFGHTTVNASGPVCPCGNSGCLELFASGRAIERFMQTTTSGPVELQHIRRAELAGDPLAHAAFKQAGEYLGYGLVTLAHLLNPSVISLGGGVVAASPTFIEATRQVTLARLLPPFRSHLIIEKSRVGNKGGIVGGALLALAQSG